MRQNKTESYVCKHFPNSCRWLTQQMAPDIHLAGEESSGAGSRMEGRELGNEGS